MIKVAVDAMGGDNSPEKIINGIIHHHKTNKNVFYKIFGDKEKIINCIPENLDKNNYEIIHTIDVVKGTDTPLEAAKRGKKKIGRASCRERV